MSSGSSGCGWKESSTMLSYAEGMLALRAVLMVISDACTVRAQDTVDVAEVGDEQI